MQPEGRVTLAALTRQGKSLRQIGQVLGRNASNLTRELASNAQAGSYALRGAQQACEHRRRKARPKPEHPSALDGSFRIVERLLGQGAHCGAGPIEVEADVFVRLNEAYEGGLRLHMHLAPAEQEVGVDPVLQRNGRHRSTWHQAEFDHPALEGIAVNAPPGPGCKLRRYGHDVRDRS